MLVNKTVLVTGARGFLGQHVLTALQQHGARQVLPIGRDEADLREKWATYELFAKHRPDIVVHLAANCGGIGYNEHNAGRLFYDNMQLNLSVLEAARLCNIPKLVTVGSVCAYPKFAQPPFHEDMIWNGYPEETNAPYGLAKRMLLAHGHAYRKQYGMNIVHLIPVNLYGPGDCFAPNRSHAIPALIRKIQDALDTQSQTVSVWGTGRATREFLYVVDAADAIARAAAHYDGEAPINLGTGHEISIQDTVQLLCKLMDFHGALVPETDRPDGQPRRSLNTLRAQQQLSWTATTSLDVGLLQTIEWYRFLVAARL